MQKGVKTASDLISGDPYRRLELELANTRVRVRQIEIRSSGDIGSCALTIGYTVKCEAPAEVKSEVITPHMAE